MTKRHYWLAGLLLIGLAAAALSLPVSDLSAQSPTPTASGLEGFLGGAQVATTPTPASNPVAQALAKENYFVFTSGPWYDAAGKPAANVVHVFMPAAAPDLKSEAGIKQIATGIAALRAAYPNAAEYHVLLLSGPNVYGASTTANSLQLLSTNLMTADAFITQVLNGVKTTSLVGGSTTTTTTTNTTTSNNTAQATAAPTKAPTRAPTRIPTVATSTCNPPPGMARLWVKNGYSGVMRFTVGGDEWGTHDFDIPADGQYHFIDMPPSSKYTYSASIPGVGKASAKLPPYSAGQCYELTFTP